MTTQTQTYTLKRDDARDITFTGAEIASASSKGRSRETGRWTEITLYRTAGGKYICETVGHTQWEGEKIRHSVEVVDSLEAVPDIFGAGWLAKELYAEGGVPFEEVIE